jgi:hypothetical protein
MRPDTRTIQTCRREQGAVLALVAVVTVVLVGFVALAVDIGYTRVARNQLQNVADGAALGATRALGNMYQNMSYEDQQSYDVSGADTDTIQGVALDVASNNRAAAAPVSLRLEDVTLGQWDGDNFTVTTLQPDAVRVVARRDAMLNGPVATFFARVFGSNQVPVSASAIAALTGQSTAGPGDVELPIGISRWFFDHAADPEAFCDQDIKFYPTNDPDSCAGWTSFDSVSNDANIRHILNGDAGYENPETIANETSYEFTGGTLSNPTFAALLTLFQQEGCDVDVNGDFLPLGSTEDNCSPQVADPVPLPDPRTDPLPGAGEPVALYERDAAGNLILDADGNPQRLLYPDGTPRNRHKWRTGTVVYDSADCSNPNQTLDIVGFAEVELTDVLDAPDKLVRGRVKCNYVGSGADRGGGGRYGKKGSIPGLVQ